MKTIGFTDAGIAALLASESVLICTVAAITGLLIAQGLLPVMSAASGGAIPGVRLPGIVFVIGVDAAVLLGLASVLPAAWRASRLSIIDALAVH